MSDTAIISENDLSKSKKIFFQETLNYLIPSAASDTLSNMIFEKKKKPLYLKRIKNSNKHSQLSAIK